MSRTARHLSVIFIVAATVLTTKPCAWSQKDAGTPVFRLQVRRVPIDVVVLDKNGNPVRGLKKGDFMVKENGKAQHILSFDMFDGSAPSFIPPKAPPLAANTFTDVPSAPERGPLYILYYDMVNTPKEDHATFRSELLKFADNAPAGTRMALFVNAKGLHLIQGFTTDRNQLREAILRKGPGPHIPDIFLDGNVYGTYDASAALSNLNFIAEYMSGIPGRKNLIWLASYFPIPTGPTLVGTGASAMASAPSVAGQVGAGGGPEVLDLSDLLKDSMKRTYSNMMRTQMALYPVSLGGVGSAEYAHPGDSVLDYKRMDDIAAATGGRAYYANNFPHTLMDKAITHGETYYTLSYDPTNVNFDGSARTIDVTLAQKNKDYRLTYRRSYYALSDDDKTIQHKKEPEQARFLAAKQEDNLYANIEHGAPILHDLLFSAHVSPEGEPQAASTEQMQALEDSPAYFKTRQRHKSTQLKPIKLQKYVIDYGVIDPQLKVAAAHNQKATLEFAAAAYSDDGILLNSMLNRGVPSGNKSGDKSAALFHAIQELDVPPGAAFIRVAVRDVLTNRTGTLEVRLPLQPETTSARTAAPDDLPAR
jgi:VWFA-related protein